MGSNVFESSRERSDFEGSADCEKGVIGEAKLAEVLAAPVELGNAVLSCGGAWFALLTGVGGLWRADMAMYVSTHFAGTSKLAVVCYIAPIIRCPNSKMQHLKLGAIQNGLCLLTQYCLLEFTSLVNVQELASTQRKDHALVVLLQLVVDLCCYQRGELSLGERLIFVERLTMTHMLVAGIAVDAAGRQPGLKSSYI